jgi:hypothetical protein
MANEFGGGPANYYGTYPYFSGPLRDTGVQMEYSEPTEGANNALATGYTGKTTSGHSTGSKTGAFNKFISDPVAGILEALADNKYKQYAGFEVQDRPWYAKYGDIANSRNSRMIETGDRFNPNDVEKGMHLKDYTNVATPSQEQLLKGEPGLEFLNKAVLNSQFTDQRKQLREGINPLDVLTKDDLNTFYGNMYGSQMQSSEDLQRQAERLFAKRGVDEAGNLARADVHGNPISTDLEVIDDGPFLGSWLKNVILGNYEDGEYTGEQTKADEAKLEDARKKAAKTIETGGVFSKGGNPAPKFDFSAFKGMKPSKKKQ